MRKAALLFCCSLAWAQEARPPGIVGVQARRNVSFRGRSMPVQTRQVGVVVGKGLVLTASLGMDAESVRVFLPGTTDALDAEVVDSDATFTVLRAPDVTVAPVAFDRRWRPAVGDGVTWIGLLAGAQGRWTPVHKPARIDALLPDEAQGAGQAYSDPPFRGPVTTICALILDADGKAVGLMVPRAPAQTGRAGGRASLRRGGAGLPVVRPASSFAQYLGGEIAARGVLGITGEALGKKIAQALGVEGARGVLITQVTPGTGAASAGIQAQMIIVKVGEQPTPTLAALQQALRGKQAGETVAVEVLTLADDRDPVTKTISVELTARDAPDKENRFRAPRFGFQAEPLTALVRRTYGLGEGVSGVHVRRVTRGSPAALARPTPLRRGDVILRVGDTPVKDVDALEQALEGISNGMSVTFFVRHASDTRFVEIKPEAPAAR